MNFASTSADSDMNDFVPNLWYKGTCVSHVQTSKPYTVRTQVALGIGHGISIKSIGTAKFSSRFNTRVMLKLHKLLNVPTIKKNLLSVSQFAKDNNVFFEFHTNYCLVKSQVTKQVLLKGIAGHDGLYAFRTVPSTEATQTHVNSQLKSHSSPSTSTPTVNNVEYIHCNKSTSSNSINNGKQNHCNKSTSLDSAFCFMAF